MKINSEAAEEVKRQKDANNSSLGGCSPLSPGRVSGSSLDQSGRRSHQVPGLFELLMDLALQMSYYAFIKVN